VRTGCASTLPKSFRLAKAALPEPASRISLEPHLRRLRAQPFESEPTPTRAPSPCARSFKNNWPAILRSMPTRRGPVRAPLLLWGPYLWADGATPRKSDGLFYAPEDLGPMARIRARRDAKRSRASCSISSRAIHTRVRGLRGVRDSIRTG
jgi:hypothetical protein